MDENCGKEVDTREKLLLTLLLRFGDSTVELYSTYSQPNPLQLYKLLSF